MTQPPFTIIEGCPLGDTETFLAATLSSDIGDYPGGLVFPIDKPLRWTSADVVRKLKFALQRHFRDRRLKVGHAGTLDPLATGVLLVCAGAATKRADELQASSKEYEAEVCFGATTPSFDLEQEPDSFFPFKHITREKLLAATEEFIGAQEQVPPVFSAKIVGGIRSYEYARSGESVELRRTPVEIYSIELLDFTPGEEAPAGSSEGPMPDAGDGDAVYLREGERPEVSPLVKHVRNYHTAVVGGSTRLPVATLRIRCSKGTYIRSLARDLGLALESGAHLRALRRTASGDFRLQ